MDVFAPASTMPHPTQPYALADTHAVQAPTLAFPTPDVPSVHAAIAPAIAHQLAETPHLAAPPMEPLVDPASWRIAKHLVQVALILMSVTVALRGGGELAMSAGYAVTCLLAMTMFVLADRGRFVAAHGRPEDLAAATQTVNHWDAAASRDPISGRAIVAEEPPLAFGGYEPVPAVPTTYVRRHTTQVHTVPEPIRISVT